MPYYKPWHRSSDPCCQDGGDLVPFDGARHFGRVTMVVLAALLLSVPALGCWPAVGAALGLYYLLVFFNALEQRDLDDSAQRQRTRTQPRRKTGRLGRPSGRPSLVLFLTGMNV